jgi:hypothetical protein
MVKVETFLALEESLTLRLYDTFQALVEEPFAFVQSLIEEQAWDKAKTHLQKIDLDPVYELNKQYIRYLSHLAMLFGASRVTDDPERSTVGLGFEKDTVNQMMVALYRSINGIEQALIDNGLQLIAQKQNPEPADDSGGAYLKTVLKASTKLPAVLPFASFMQAEGRTLFNIASSLHTSRLASFGFTSEARALGITRYGISEQLDGRTCPVCSYMHGKTFDVEDARGLLDIAVRTQDPKELKFLQPWPSQSKAGVKMLKAMNKTQLVQNGWHVPPFHPRCRGVLVRVGKVPVLGESEAKPAEKYQASQADFEQLGIKFTNEKVALWNELIHTAPAEVLSHLTGTSPSDLIAALMGDASAGWGTIKTAKQGINVQSNLPAFGSKHPIKQDLWFRTDNSFFVGSVEFQPDDIKKFKSVVQGLYGVAREAEMERMVFNAGGDISGYALAKYGFTISPVQWKALKRQLQKNIDTSNVLDMATPVQEKALAAILASDDPKSIFALSDLPHLGKALLSDTAWSGSLDFSDTESMARFLSYFG